jgi:2-methylisocitrate lyase-like PEP mutase family enzyme
MNHPGAELRRLLSGTELTLSVCAHDPLTARLIAAAGFSNVFVSGNAVAAFQFGLPDMGFVTLSEIVDVCRRITAVTRVPVLVDADTGYGNAVQVTRTVSEFERAGVAGINIEDQIPYKKCAMIESLHPVVSAEEHAAKIYAACQARNNPDFVIGARTDASHDHGVDEAIRRARLYVEAGADLLDIEVKGTEEDLEKIAAARFKVPLMANMDEGKELWRRDSRALFSAGYRIAVHPGALRYTLVRAAMDALDTLKREGGTAGLQERMCSVKEFFAAVDVERYLDMERRLLPSPESTSRSS